MTCRNDVRATYADKRDIVEIAVSVPDGRSSYASGRVSPRTLHVR